MNRCATGVRGFGILSFMLEQVLGVLAKISRDRDRLSALKPTRVENEVDASFAQKSGTLQVTSNRYKNRIQRKTTQVRANFYCERVFNSFHRLSKFKPWLVERIRPTLVMWKMCKGEQQKYVWKAVSKERPFGLFTPSAKTPQQIRKDF